MSEMTPRPLVVPDGDTSVLRWLLLFALLGIALYLPVLNHGYFTDDTMYVGIRNRVLHAIGWDDLWRFLIYRTNDWEFLPVRDFSYWLDMQFFGVGPRGHHVVNVVLYAGCCYVTYQFVRILLNHVDGQSKSDASLWAALAAVAFVFHPAHVEAVAWISGRKDLLAMFFSTAAGSAYLVGLDRAGSLRSLAASAALMLLACFSKSVAAFFVIAFPFLAAVSIRRGSLGLGRAVVYLVVPISVAAFSLAVHVAVGAETGIGLHNELPLLPLVERASRILVVLLGILVLPTDPRMIYDVFSLGSWHWYVSAIAVGMLAYSIWRMLSGRASMPAVGILLTLIPLMPYLQFSPFLTWSLASERFVFQASLGLVIILAVLARSTRNTRVVALAVSVLIGLMAMTVIVPRIAQWESPHELREDNLKVIGPHHSAVREQMYGYLLPMRRYGEASALASQIVDGRVRALALRLFEAVVLRDSETNESTAQVDFHSAYCDVAVPLDLELKQMSACGDIQDITIVSFFSQSRTYLAKRVGDVSVLCSKRMHSVQ